MGYQNFWKTCLVRLVLTHNVRKQCSKWSRGFMESKYTRQTRHLNHTVCVHDLIVPNPSITHFGSFWTKTNSRWSYKVLFCQDKLIRFRQFSIVNSRVWQLPVLPAFGYALQRNLHEIWYIKCYSSSRSLAWIGINCKSGNP